MKRLRSESGSTLVEMAFIFPMIVFIIIIMLFFGMFLYEQVAAQAVLDDVASRAAANWATVDEGVYTEKSSSDDFSALDIYSRVLDFKDDAREKSITSEALRRLRVMCPFSGSFQDDSVSVQSHNIVVYKSLDVTVDQTFALPFGGFLSALGIPSELHYRLTGSATVQDPPELIRTIDLAADLLERTGLGSLYEKAKAAMEKLTDFFRTFEL